jgi:hypothetical protein
MSTCAEYSDSLLDFLYGLLDEQTAKELQDHLAGCAACQQSLAEARTQQNLLGQAALHIREVVPFEAPADEGITTPFFSHFPSETKPIVAAATPLPRPRRRPWRRRLVGTAIAAAVLAAVGLAILYQNGLTDREAKAAAARKEVEKVNTQLLNLDQDYKAAEKNLAGTVQGQFLQVQLLGPANYQGSAATPYRLVTQTLTGQPASAAVSVRLVTREPDHDSDQVLFQDEYATTGELRFQLPPRLPVEAGLKPRLVIEVKSGPAKEIIDQPLATLQPSYLTHICLSKNIYHTGDVLFFRTVTLDRYAFTPVKEPLNLEYALYQVAGGKMQLRKQLRGATEAGGIGGGEFAVTDDLAEGEYLLSVTEAAASPSAGFRQAVQPLRILRDDQPRVVLDRKEYKPGDTVNLTYMAQRMPNGTNQPVKLRAASSEENSKSPKSGGKGKANNDGKDKEAWESLKSEKTLQAMPDARGNAQFKVPLPANVPPGNIELEVEYPNGKKYDKITQTIRIVDPQIGIDFFPEGGDLIAGVPNRVYFRVSVPTGYPQGLTAVVEDYQNREVAKLPLDGEAVTFVPGQILGSFIFTPRFGDSYRAKLSAAGKSIDSAPLPRVLVEGVSLTTPSGVLSANDPVRVQVRDTRRGMLLVLLSCRGQTVDQKLVQADENTTEVTLEPIQGAGGVLRVTAYEKASGGWQPAAERLIYRMPAEYLQLSARLEKGTGQNARLRLESKTEAGVPTPVWMHAMCTADRGKISGPSEPGLPVFFLAASELKGAEDLEDVEVIINDAKKAPRALDLFLGTHGWRRFSQQPELAPPALMAAGDVRSVPADAQSALVTAGTRPDNVRERYQRELVQRSTLLASTMTGRAAQLQAQRDSAVSAAEQATQGLAEYEQLPLQVLRLSVAYLILALIVAGALQLLAALVVAVRARRSPRLLLAGSCCALLLAVVVYLVTPGLRHLDQDVPSGASAVPSGQDFAFNGNEGRGHEHERRDNRQADNGLGGEGGTKVVSKVFVPPSPSSRAAMGDKKADAPLEPMNLALLDTVNRQMLYRDNALATDDNANAFQRVASDMKDRFEQTARTYEAGGYGGGPAPGPVSPPSGEPQKTDGKGKQLPGGAGGGGKSSKDTGEQDKIRQLREYTHTYSKASPVPPDLVLWHPILFADGGTAEVRFDLAPNVTNYRITVFGHSPGGRLGMIQEKVQAK